MAPNATPDCSLPDVRELIKETKDRFETATREGLITDLDELEMRNNVAQAIVTATDLKDLNFLALARPHLTGSERQTFRRASRRQMLLDFGRQVCDRDAVSGTRSHVDKHAVRYAFPTRCRTLSHILRRA
ncbi:hypothetical protein BD413DRAFT_165726 [Trametes elegans]|nr:hypothetical protein BD413DRAFT_165726 [Trametes elegans]